MKKLVITYTPKIVEGTYSAKWMDLAQQLLDQGEPENIMCAVLEVDGNSKPVIGPMGVITFEGKANIKRLLMLRLASLAGMKT